MGTHWVRVSEKNHERLVDLKQTLDVRSIDQVIGKLLPSEAA
jgi:hypothetical protein